MRRKILRWSLRVGALLAAFALGGFLVAASGVYPIAASGGHWGVTESIFEFGKRRSVATHSLMIEPLELDEPWLVLKGAGHYETACRPCHGSPDLRSPRLARAMLPPPPYLPDRVDDWSPEELFYIVKHGLKLTGMPAWPTQERDDEVRAMIAFLLAMPGLDAEDYRRLVHGDVPSAGGAALPDLLEPAQAPRVIETSCARCHGVDGRGRGNAAFPALAGQSRVYLERALDAYASDDRHSGIMQPIAAGLDRAERRAVAEYYARLPSGSATEPPADAATLARGARIATRGIAERGLPSCRDCHGPTSWERNPAYPMLAGQYAGYLVLQLELFREDRRGGSSYAHLMDHVAPRLRPDEIRVVAAYYASIGGSPPDDAASRLRRSGL